MSGYFRNKKEKNQLKRKERKLWQQIHSSERNETKKFKSDELTSEKDNLNQFEEDEDWGDWQRNDATSTSLNVNETGEKDPESENDIDRSEESEDYFEKIVKQPRSTEFQNEALVPLNIPQLKDHVICSLQKFKGELYIGGSDGLLLKYNRDEINFFRKSTNETIILTLKMKANKDYFIIAFTDTTILKYSVNQYFLSKCQYPGLRNAITIRNATFMTDKRGTLSRLQANLVRASLGLSNVLCFNEGTGIMKLALVSFENSSLYKYPDSSSFANGELVEGVSHVESVLLYGHLWCCCTTDRVYVMDRNCIVVDQWVFDKGIKFISGFRVTAVVADRDNVVYIYHKCNEVHRQKVDGEITALEISTGSHEAYVAVGDKVFLMKYHSKY